MNSHNLRTRKIRGRIGEAGVMQLLAEKLETPTEAEAYAGRLELVGQILFGDLWKTDPRRSSTDTEKLL